MSKKVIISTSLYSIDPDVLDDNRINLYGINYGGRQFLMDNDEDIQELLKQLNLSKEDLKNLYGIVKSYRGNFQISGNKCLSVIINGNEIAKLYGTFDIDKFLENIKCMISIVIRLTHLLCFLSSISVVSKTEKELKADNILSTGVMLLIYEDFGPELYKRVKKYLEIVFLKKEDNNFNLDNCFHWSDDLIRLDVNDRLTSIQDKSKEMLDVTSVSDLKKFISEIEDEICDLDKCVDEKKDFFFAKEYLNKIISDIKSESSRKYLEDMISEMEVESETAKEGK